jgi:hypothetical protein
MSTLASDGLRFNAKQRRGLIWYLLGRLFPALFGMPLHLEVVVRDATGRVKQRRRIYNTVTTAGKNALMDQMLASPTLGKPTHMGIGTGTGGTTTLTTELDRNALTSKTRSTNVVTMVGDWAAGDGTGRSPKPACSTRRRPGTCGCTRPSGPSGRPPATR